MTVHIQPLPRWCLKHPTRFRPGIPPMFRDLPEGEGPTEADKALAYELFLALDPESRAWYRRSSPTIRAMEESKNSNRHKRYHK